MTDQPRTNKFRFIPYRKHDLLQMCLEASLLSGREAEFRSLYYMLSSIFHFEFHQITESLKDAYAAIDPDSDTRPYENNDRLTKLNFVDLLGRLLDKANYEQVSEEEVNQALNESSLFKIRLHVNFDDFSEVLIFRRGQTIRKETVRSCMGLVSKTIEFTNFERVVMYIRFRDDYQETQDQLPSRRVWVDFA